ncbi:hypothetical protein [Streptomyces sp. G-5]|uniref:hypothetical protein n=1 Tax=Streptomyces sp. G-5 TaxID=2977231 RepID=UPI0021D27DF0|nr:hypothetical protein [Streptomyces sp. G-5]MCU4750270.1 hypothetical protein [Streptomyces sp. G-5]
MKSNAVEALARAMVTLAEDSIARRVERQPSAGEADIRYKVAQVIVWAAHIQLHIDAVPALLSTPASRGQLGAPEYDITTRRFEGGQWHAEPTRRETIKDAWQEVLYWEKRRKARLFHDSHGIFHAIKPRVHVELTPVFAAAMPTAADALYVALRRLGIPATVHGDERGFVSADPFPRNDRDERRILIFAGNDESVTQPAHEHTSGWSAWIDGGEDADLVPLGVAISGDVIQDTADTAHTVARWATAQKRQA